MTTTPTFIDTVVVGAGPGGLATAKALLDLGVPFLVLEAASVVGGVWRGDGTGCAWGGLITNLSAEKCALSDLPHPSDIPDFPTASHMSKYFEHYATDLGLRAHIQFNCKVLRVAPCEAAGAQPGRHWTVEWVNTRGTRQDSASFVCHARYVVVATGAFAVPWIPAGIARKAERAGVIAVHARGLNLDAFAERVRREKPLRATSGERIRVLVVGAAYTGADLSVALSQSGSFDVAVVVHQPRWFQSRRIHDEAVGPGSHPWDRLWERRTAGPDSWAEEPPAYRNTTSHADRHGFLRSKLVDPATAHPALAIDDDRDSAQTVICDGFLDAITSRRVAVITRDQLDGMSDTALAAQFDAIVFATGYRADLSFLSEEVLSACELDASSDFLPLILYKSTLHPTSPYMGFVGMFRGPYMAMLDVQARWIAAVAAGRVPYPSQAVRQAQLEEERVLRRFGSNTSREMDEELRTRKSCVRRNCFPHPNYIAFTDSLAEEFRARPLPSQVPELNRTNAVAWHYRLRADDASNGPLPEGHPSVATFYEKRRSVELATRST